MNNMRFCLYCLFRGLLLGPPLGGARLDHPDWALFDHGYGLVEVTAEQATAQMLYFPILKPGGEVTEGPVWTVEAGAPQWRAQK